MWKYVAVLWTMSTNPSTESNSKWWFDFKNRELEQCSCPCLPFLCPPLSSSPLYQQLWLSELTKWAIDYKGRDSITVFNKCKIKNVYMIPKFWHMPSGKVCLLPVEFLKLVFHFHFIVCLEQCVPKSLACLAFIW